MDKLKCYRLLRTMLRNSKVSDAGGSSDAGDGSGAGGIWVAEMIVVM